MSGTMGDIEALKKEATEFIAKKRAQLERIHDLEQRLKTSRENIEELQEFFEVAQQEVHEAKRWKADIADAQRQQYAQLCQNPLLFQWIREAPLHAVTTMCDAEHATIVEGEEGERRRLCDKEWLERGAGSCFVEYLEKRGHIPEEERVRYIWSPERKEEAVGVDTEAREPELTEGGDPASEPSVDDYADSDVDRVDADWLRRKEFENRAEAELGNCVAQFISPYAKWKVHEREAIRRTTTIGHVARRMGIEYMMIPEWTEVARPTIATEYRVVIKGVPLSVSREEVLWAMRSIWLRHQPQSDPTTYVRDAAPYILPTGQPWRPAMGNPRQAFSIFMADRPAQDLMFSIMVRGPARYKWDVHGVWIAVGTEQIQGLVSIQDIPMLGVEKFV